MTNSSAYLLFKHRKLLLRVTKDEIAARYAGTLLGLGWAVVSPLLLIIIYAVVYLAIFRVQASGLSSVGYVLHIFAGMVPFLATSEALGAGVSSVVGNKAMLNSTVFPIDLAPVKAALISQATMVTGVAVILVVGVFSGTLSRATLLLPIIWTLQLMALIGLNWMLSLLNVIFRDLQNMIGLIIMILMIISPIAYTPAMVPDQLKVLIIMNPLAYFVVAYQDIMVLGQIPSVPNLVVLFILSIGLFILGNMVFTRARRVIADYV